MNNHSDEQESSGGRGSHAKEDPAAHSDDRAAEALSDPQHHSHRADVPPSEHAVTQRRSWFLYLVALCLTLVAADYALQQIGSSLYWSEKFLYAWSLALRFILIFAAGVWQFKRTLNRDPDTLYTVHGWAGLVSAALLAAMRFASYPALWTFLNMITEPLYGLCSALVASYLINRYNKGMRLNAT